ncbi:MAG TPA: glycosyltransferase family 4 protein [Thermoanaerobaculia bacterium]
MRVLIVTDWMRHAGGAERYVADLRRGLAAAGNEVRLLTSSAGSAAEGTADHVAWASEARWVQSVEQIVNLPAAATVRRTVRDFAPEIVLVNMFANHLSPAIFAALGGAPTFLAVTDFKLVCPVFSKILPDGTTCREPEGMACLRRRCVGLPHWLRDRPRYALMRRVVRRVEGVFACSETVRIELARNGVESEVIALPVDPPGEGFRRRPAAKPLFVFSGRLAAQKGVFELAAAFARLRTEAPTARLRFVGDGPDRGALERRLAELGVGEAVDFTGWVTRESVEEHLADAWAAVAPTRGPEPLGMVALEAIVRGIPVVATRGGGFLETVAEGVTGLLVADGDVDALCGALQRIAHRASFPTHALDAAIAARTLAERDLGKHVAALGARFAATVGRRRRYGSS